MTPFTPTALLIFAGYLLIGILFIYWMNKREEKRLKNQSDTRRKAFPSEIEKKLMLDEHEQRIS